MFSVRRLSRWLACFQGIVVVLYAVPCRAAPADVAFFEQKIRPILVEHCYSCHSATARKVKGNLLLDSRAGWQRGGDSGEPAVVPGKPEESLLIRAVRHQEPGFEMPPDRPRLPDAVLADLVAWVKMGAPDPREGKAEVRRADKTWWSLQPNKTDLQTAGTIDDFILAKLKANGLSLNPPADPRTLIRRMTYDLHGLPPTPEEVDEFVRAYTSASPRLAVSPSSAKDTETRGHGDREQVYEALVDRLLASPRYGERWGRHWLDVVRFGESNGFERNFIIDDLYPFRDYVIRSLNEDKPFDRFIVEHLAGDVVGRGDPDVEIGSAFLAAGPFDDVGNQDATAQKNIRAATLDDMITAVGGAFLGLTLNCARCHNHKFDPIPAEDYYRVRAALEGVKHGRRVVATDEQRQAHAAAMEPLNRSLAALQRERDDLDKSIQARVRALPADKPTRPKVDPHGTEEKFAAVDARYVRFVIHEVSTDFPKGPGRVVDRGKLTEFQVWDVAGRNVALATNGTRAEGAKSTTAEDFPEAYGPQYCIDGLTGEAWFIGTPAVLTLMFARTEKVHRIAFINARGERGTDESRVRGATPTGYEVQVSLDGKTWKTVADDAGREPWSPAHAAGRARRQAVTPEEEKRLTELEKRIGEVQAKIGRVPKLPSIWAGIFAQPKEKTFLHRGGDPTKPGDEIQPASLSVLDGVVRPYQLTPNSPEGERRLALGRWITAADNPLTPRVLANRVWHYHFGAGIVDTPSDFGFLGGKPSHPELLDYLAARLVANGWRLKPLHREILLSQTYRQSAVLREEAARVDGTSRLLWRFPPRRLSGEELRDTMLTVAGKIRLEPMGGPGFRLYRVMQNNVSTYFPLDAHGPETYRRAVYHQNVRAGFFDLLSDFDLPDTAFSAPKRADTTTPLQALTLINHSFTLDMAKAAAERLAQGKSTGEDDVTAAYRMFFQRPPTKTERAAAAALVKSHGPIALCRALLNANELLYLE